MGLNRRANHNKLHTSIPLLDHAGNVEGWYQFTDVYLSPSVLYTAFPPRTLLTIGSRKIEIDRAVPLKIRLLEEDEDYHFWCKKRQHSQRITCAEYHRDFGDVEVGYSFSSPQTHIWFAGYAIHAECLENLCFSSYSASIRITPEHVVRSSRLHEQKGVALNELTLTKSLFEMVVEEGADFPIYATAIPKRVSTTGGYITEMVPTAEFVNDCERIIQKVEAYDVGVGVSDQSDPTQYPPTFPGVRPFEHPSLFWSYVHNELLKKRLARDELEQAVKDIAILVRRQNYRDQSERQDRLYREALNRLSDLFANDAAIHRVAFPMQNGHIKCHCELCASKKKRALSHRQRTRPSPRDDEDSDGPEALDEGAPVHHHHHVGAHSHRGPAKNTGYYQDVSEHKCAVCRTKEPEKPWSHNPQQAAAGSTLITLCSRRQG